MAVYLKWRTVIQLSEIALPLLKTNKYENKTPCAANPYCAGNSL
jgi:hypothetical protein